jgi:hypothetical protein
MQCGHAHAVPPSTTEHGTVLPLRPLPEIGTHAVVRISCCTCIGLLVLMQLPCVRLGRLLLPHSLTLPDYGAVADAEVAIITCDWTHVPVMLQ